MGMAWTRWVVARGLGPPVAERGMRGEERPSGVGPSAGERESEAGQGEKRERAVGAAVGCGFDLVGLRPLGLAKLSGSAQWREGEMGPGQER